MGPSIGHTVRRFGHAVSTTALVFTMVVRESEVELSSSGEYLNPTHVGSAPHIVTYVRRCAPQPPRVAENGSARVGLHCPVLMSSRFQVRRVHVKDVP